MRYHEYLNRFDSKQELINDIKENFTNSREFVNLFLEYTIDKSIEDKDRLFNDVVNSVAKILIKAGGLNGR